MYCPKCGKENLDDARFCMHCGADLSGYKAESSPKIEVNPTIDVSLNIEKLRDLKIPDKEEAIVEVVKEFNKTLRTIGIPNRVDSEKGLNLNPVQNEIARAVEEKVNEILGKVKKPVGDPETYIKIGNYERDLENYDKALNYFDKAIELDSNKVEAWIGKGQVWFNEGNALSNAERYEEAIRYYDRALATYNRVSADYKGRIDKAKYPPPSLFFLDEDIIFALENKGDTLLLLGRHDEAIECYNKVLEINQNYYPIWAMKEVVFEELGKHDLARQCHDEMEKAKKRFDEQKKIEGAKYEELMSKMRELNEKIAKRRERSE